MEYKYDVIWSSKLPKLKGKEIEILRLHLEDKISVLKLSELYGCDRKPIQNIIKHNGYATRPSTSPDLEGKEDEILKMYLDQQLTIQTIRKKIGCTFNTIKGFLKRNGVTLRTADESRQTEDGKVKGIVQRLTTSKELIDAIEMYNNGEVLEKIGKLYNITPRGLQQKFIKEGVKMRTLTESANLPNTYERKKVTNLEHWGVENPMQHPEINERSSISAYKFKSADIYGRRFSHLQGFEPQGIKYLVDQMGVDINDVQSGRKVPTVRYKFEGKNKMYFSDMYVEPRNLLVEVKCDYTYNKDLDKNKAKREAAINAGYDYLTIIFANNGRDISRIF